MDPSKSPPATSPPDPVDPQEQRRLEELRRFGILDTQAEESFDRLVRIASLMCGTPIALVSLVDAERQWFKARLGLAVAETPRAISFCTHTIQSADVMVVEDTREDARFAAGPLVTGAPNIRFYAGAPLITSTGARIGTLCVLDHVPHAMTGEQRRGLVDLAAIVVDELELRSANRRLVERTHVDAMTGAFNRQYFLELAEIERARGTRYNRPLGLLTFDIDHFKRVNDTWGHATGDVAIVAIVKEAKSTLRRQDVLARIGGEEFAALLPETDLEGSRLIAERLRARIAKLKLRHEATEFSVTISIGVALVDAKAGIRDAMKRADAALYEAKHAGRDRVRVAAAKP